MSRFAFRGMMAPTFTPFKKNGSLNLEVIPAYAKCLQEGGVKGIWVSMSEFLKKGFKKVPTLAGIKFTDMDVSGEGRKCVEVDSGSLTIFSGFDKTLQEALSVGFSCAVNGGFSFLPQFGSQIFSLMEAGNVSEAKRMQEVLSSHFDVIFKETGKEYTVASLKTATSLLTGVEMGPVRFPVKALSDQKIDNLKNAFKNLGLKVY
ncbi:N-acetylneuraminate lyase-like isoform X2 [Homarus americanus]|uniref:N-acetylneuraminate lyase-like isoform X2 n=1 Tax=Homarus americanus TaxID=6706 RepID=UPI001C490336|nr:N-acetylneuraminate lyase-like isoform X2 [Homarus americanus]